MSSLETTRDDLERENRQLREQREELEAQLAEAQETLRAIREGDLDALVVTTPQGRQIYTLQGTDQTYQAFVEQMQEGAVTLVDDGRVGYSNRRFAELVGQPLEKVIGKPFSDFVARKQRNHFDRLLRQTRQASTSGEMTLRNSDGGKVPVQVGMSMVVLNGKSSICIVVTDLSDQKRAERILASEQHYRLLFERNPDGIFTVDAAGRFLVANPACEVLSGYAADELRHMAFQDLCTPDRLAATLAHFERAAREPTYSEIETALIRKDGRRVELWVTGEPIVSNGEIVAVHCTAKDITDRKETEQSLQRSLAQWTALFHQMTEGLILFDPEGNLLDMNPAALAIHGYDSVDSIRRHLDSLTDTFELFDLQGNPLPIDRWPIGRVLRGETFDSYVVQCHRRDSGLTWTGSYGGAPVCGADGKLLLAIVTLRDVTTQREAEEQLRRRAEEVESLMEIVPAAIWVSHDPQCFHIVGNRRANELYEAAEQENVSAGLSNSRRFFRDGVEVSAGELPMQVAAATGQDVKDEELDVLLPSGRWISIWGTARPLRDAKGRVRGAIGAFMETTVYKKAEEALRESEAFYRQTLESIPGMVFTTRPDGYCDYQSRQWAVFTGVPLEEQLGDRWNTLLHPEDQSRVYAAWREAVETETLYDVEYRVRRHDGAYEWFKVIGRPIRDASGRIVRWFGVAANIHELKHVEQELRVAREAAETANVAKSQFLANMSHELRTPMNAILGMTDLALREELSPALADYLETVKDSGESLLDLLNTLLDFSRIEAGQMELDSCPFRLRKTVMQVAKALAVQAAEKELELICDVEVDVPDGVVGDPLRLRQVLMNLVGNAVKFTREGEVVITAAVQSRSEEEVLLQFAVRDTGPGIASEDQQRVFSPFTQADAATTRRYGGSGLGLAIVQNLVAIMGGDVQLHSEAGRGSTFSFTVRLGLQSEPDAAPSCDLAERQAVEGLPVLVVSENVTSRRILERMVSAWNMEPTVARNVPSALAKVHQAAALGTRFRVVLADVDLPDIDGFSLAEWLGKNPSLAGPVVLMLSATKRSRQSQRCREIGAACVEKPISESDLFDAIVRSLGMQRAPRAEEEDFRSTAASRTLRILLAEDTPANQKLATYLLTGRGHVVEVAENGQQAVDRLRAEKFDVVLMDVQMPVMDGMKATAAIRELDDPAKARVPIVAMTAHALRGDAQRCIAAGMDGYVSKPIDADELIELVERMGETRQRPADTNSQAADPQAAEQVTPEAAGGGSSEQAVMTAPFDLDEGVRRCFNRYEMFEKMVAGFFDEADWLLADIRAGMERKDAEAVHQATHRLKNTVVYLGAAPASAATEQLEKLARSGDLTQAADTVDRLAVELERLKPALADHRPKGD